jgi:hypothetical protein
MTPAGSKRGAKNGALGIGKWPEQVLAPFQRRHRSEEVLAIYRFCRSFISSRFTIFLPHIGQPHIDFEFRETGERMSLHSTEELKAAPINQIESELLNGKTETYEFPRGKQDPQTVYQTIHDQLILDGNSQQNLAPPGSNPKSSRS